MIIAVTAEDIQNGERCNPQTCPIALAIKRATGKQVIVGYDYVVMEGFGKEILMPRKARDFRERFDNIREGEPFSFEIHL